jgi:uncharacterized membrane protein
MSSTQRSPARRHPLAISPPIARGLSVLSIGALWGWFFLKFSLSDAPDSRTLLVGSLALIGVGAAMLLFASQYLNQAYAKDAELDERELTERNRAYRYTLFYLLAVLALAYLRTEELASPGVLANFFVVLFLTTVAFTPAVLAWWDRGEPDGDV